VIYVKGRWPDGDVPAGEPEWFYYEVKADTDVVCRTVDVFPEGRAIRNSIELSAREGPDFREPQYRSLVHGNFLTDPESLWNGAMDKPWSE
jgi:hypothetical protein